MTIHRQLGPRRVGLGLLAAGILVAASLSPSSAQIQQDVYVTIQDYNFHTTQMPLQLHTDTFIYIKNLDEVRHDFGSNMFLHTLTHVENNGVVAYGKGLEGAYIDPGKEAVIHLVLDKPGRFQFECSIHKDMKGEILLMTVDAV
ncbi:MAG: cupredoxin domain-containing protein [Nitrospirales bacterium]